METIYYAIFFAHPSTEPPFAVELGAANKIFTLSDCLHIPDSIERIKAFCKTNEAQLDANFTLLYPIYMDAMDSDYEGTMHHIAWLIKEAADKNAWKFNRTGGFTGNSVATFLPK
jgi:hypothetical protein